MSALSIQPTFPMFTATDGRPLENGYIYIGAINVDPVANPITVYWDAGLSVPATQPIRTINGYPSRAGTPARLYVNSDYSIRVLNKNGSLVYSATSATERERVSVLDFGAPTNGYTDCYAAFQAAIDALPVGGGTILIPATATNNWQISQTLDVRKKVHLIGQVAHGTGDEKGTQLIFPADVSGIVFNSATTSLYTTVAADPALPGAYGSVMENIMLLGGSGTTAADGVVIRCKMECKNVSSRGFYRYGFRIYASIGGGGSIEGDANGWKLDNCQAVANGSHGFYADGSDSNVGVAIRCTALSNTGYGFYDNSGLGNTWVGCDSAGNGTGSIYANRGTSSSTIIGFWEDGADEALLGDNVVAFGGNCGNPASSGTGLAVYAGLTRNIPLRYLNSKGSENVGVSLGHNDTSNSVLAFGTSSEGSLTTWKLKFDATYKGWTLQFADSSSFQAIHLPNSASGLYTNKGFSGPAFQNGYAVKNPGAAYSSALVRMLGTAAPVSGTYEQGDIVYNSAPTAGGYIGWVCVTGGTPGTWKTFGAITP